MKESTNKNILDNIKEDDDVYDGYWNQHKDNMTHRPGSGKHYHDAGSVYDGLWIKKTRREGGIYAAPRPENYEGDRDEDTGLYHGRGKVILPKGCMYEGSFQWGLYEGYGRFTYGDGASYAGQWKAGKRQGHGIYIFADGSTIEGEWTDRFK